MKLREDEDLEFVDLDDEGYDLPGETEDDEDEQFDERTLRFVHRVLFPSVIGIVAVVVVVAAVFLLRGRGETEDKAVPAAAEFSESQEEDGTEAVPEEEQEIPDASQQAAEDADAPEGQGAADAESGESEPDPETETMSTEQGTEVDVSQLLSSEAAAETDEITFGIDVARYQGTIDWAQVATSGVEFAMVRVGYRTDKSREIVADSNARYNMQEAQKNGIKLGAYFFSTAVNEEEAKAEADWTADYISQ